MTAEEGMNYFVFCMEFPELKRMAEGVWDKLDILEQKSITYSYFASQGMLEE